MLPGIFAGFTLLAICVAIHAAGLTYVLGRLSAWLAPESRDSGKASWILIRAAWILAALHICEILLWAGYYRLWGCVEDFATAVYFSGVSYTTIGYGDVVMPRRYWFLGPMEGLTGILMCGLSTGFFFVAVSRVFAVKGTATIEGNP